MAGYLMKRKGPSPNSRQHFTSARLFVLNTSCSLTNLIITLSSLWAQLAIRKFPFSSPSIRIASITSLQSGVRRPESVGHFLSVQLPWPNLRAHSSASSLNHVQSFAKSRTITVDWLAKACNQSGLATRLVLGTFPRRQFFDFLRSSDPAGHPGCGKSFLLLQAVGQTGL